MKRDIFDILGGEKRFGNYSVIGEGKSDAKKRFALCVCDCGAKKDVSARNLVSGRSKRCSECAKTSTDRSSSVTHGMRYTPEYTVWKSMIQRCGNSKAKNFKSYGGRGISVCERWKEFELFHSDMGLRPSDVHSIDRKDNDGNYTPENCRWATREEQSQNKRNTIYFIDGGKKIASSKIAKIANIAVSTMGARIKSGWSLDKAINQSVRGSAIAN